MTLAQRAHIVGVGRQGPRSRAAPLSDDIDAVENLTLLCGEHHRIVDANPRIYSVEVLAKYKADHEARMAPRNLRPAPPPLEADTVDLSLLPVSELPDTCGGRRRCSGRREEVASTCRGQGAIRSCRSCCSRARCGRFTTSPTPRGRSSGRLTRVPPSSSTPRRLLKSDDKNIYVWLLNGALREALLRRGVRLDRDHDRYYFLPDHETITRRVEARTKTGRAQSAKKVVRQEGEGTDHPRDIWWHLAAQLRFEQFAPGSWGLTIRPEFHLTKDGREPLEPWRVGRKVTRRKSRMYNEGYFDAVHFFRYFLLDGRARFTLKVGRQAITVDGDFPERERQVAEDHRQAFRPDLHARQRRRGRRARCSRRHAGLRG